MLGGKLHPIGRDCSWIPISVALERGLDLYPPDSRLAFPLQRIGLGHRHPLTHRGRPK